MYKAALLENGNHNGRIPSILRTARQTREDIYGAAGNTLQLSENGQHHPGHGTTVLAHNEVFDLDEHAGGRHYRDRGRRRGFVEELSCEYRSCFITILCTLILRS